MSPRLIALIVSGTVVFGAIVKLYLDTGEAAPTPSPAKIDEAKARAGRTRTAPSATNLSDPWADARKDPPRAAPSPARTATPAPPARTTPTITPRAAAVPNLEGDPRLELSQSKDEANRLYDKQDFEAAMELALKVLEKAPGDVRMLRVVVSSACQMGDADKAQKYWAQLPPHDQNQMTRRCQRFGITFASN